MNSRVHQKEDLTSLLDSGGSVFENPADEEGDGADDDGADDFAFDDLTDEGGGGDASYASYGGYYSGFGDDFGGYGYGYGGGFPGGFYVSRLMNNEQI